MGNNNLCSFWQRQQFRKADESIGPLGLMSEEAMEEYYKAREAEDEKDPPCKKDNCEACRYWNLVDATSSHEAMCPCDACVEIRDASKPKRPKCQEWGCDGCQNCATP